MVLLRALVAVVLLLNGLVMQLAAALHALAGTASPSGKGIVKSMDYKLANGPLVI